jgi:hypothetical protein
MSQVVHSIELPDGAAQLANLDRLLLGLIKGIANGVGGGAGVAVTVAVAVKNLPANYTVLVNPKQDATWFTSTHTATGFNVTLTPRLAANTLGAGTFDAVIIA